MKKFVNFAVFTLILMLFVLPSVFPNPMRNGMDSAVDNSSGINNEYIDISSQSDLNINETISENLNKEDSKIILEEPLVSSSDSNLVINDLDNKTKEKYDEEVRKFKEGRVTNSSTPMLNNISNFSYNLQYIVSIVVSFSILGYMLFKCRKTKNN